MNMFVLLVLLVWGFRVIRNILSFVHLWRVKEYRYDRMLVHLKTDQGKYIYFLPFRIPPITPKTVVVSTITIGLCAVIFFILRPHPIFALFVVDIVSFPISWIAVACMHVPTTIYHRIVIYRAIRKLADHKPMKVIGITGSYGKTSVKNYLAAILSTKYTVLKTQLSQNSPIGIAEVINAQLRPEHEVFVVEMAAYKKGEIAYMAKMVSPTVGIVTAINPQHQDLFGSLEATMQAKYELIQGLTGKKIGIFNWDNDRTRTMAQWAKRDGAEVSFFSMEGQSPDHQTIWADTISVTDTSVSFVCHMGKQQEKVKAKVVGGHQVGNILAAIAGAMSVGMTMSDAARGASRIESTPKVMERLVGPFGSICINDTFNNNPDAARASLEYLATQPGKKIFVFQPMIELGEYALASHTQVGAQAAKVCDAIILTNKNFYDAFAQGVRSVSQTVPLFVAEPKTGARYIKGRISKGDTVLFKGKESEKMLYALIPHS